MEHLLKIAKGLKKIIETDSLKHSYRNELDKACFAHDSAYCGSKDFAKRIIPDKILNDRAYEIAIIINIMDIKKPLKILSMAYKFFCKKTRSGVSVNE